MSDEKWSALSLSRRGALKVCLVPVGVAAARWLGGCADDDAAGGGAADGGQTRSDAGPSGTAPGTDANTPTTPGLNADASAPASNDAGLDAQAQTGVDASVPSDASSAATPWASGGTKSMRGNYPDPFLAGAVGTACTLYPAQTIGPCYAAGPAEREDISEGVAGVPVRLSFLVVRSGACSPVANAEVDIWHSGSNGVYSTFANGICNPDSLDVARLKYCRGKRVTDANGRVDFSTIFPGWYTGRSIHIHFTVRVGGQEFITSQLYFEDALSDELMNEVDYKARGPRDTTNRSDLILLGANLPELVFSTAKRPDGVLHAWKVLSIRA